MDEEKISLCLDTSHFYDSSQPKLYSDFLSIYKLDNHVSISKYMKIDIHKSDVTENEKTIYDQINIIDLDQKYFYKLINKSDFIYNYWVSGLKSDYFTDHYAWSFEEFFGLFKKQKKYVSKGSDSDSNAISTFILSNSKYISSKSKVFEIKGFTIRELEELLMEIYDYFYDGKIYVCINFDSMSINKSGGGGIFYEIRGIVPEDKVHPFPNNLVSDTFILSTQSIDLPNEPWDGNERLWANPIKFILGNANFQVKITAIQNENGISCYEVKIERFPVINETIWIEIDDLEKIFTWQDVRFKIFLSKTDKDFIASILNLKFKYQKKVNEINSKTIKH
jgi:hypothetical protein